MKILGIQNTKINTFKGSDKNNAEQPKNQDNNSSLDVVFLTPEFYMKLKNIKPYVICKTQQGDEYIKAKNLIIAPDITDKYLRRDNGIIDEGTILSFIKIYNSLLKDKIDQSNQNLMDYQNEKNIALLLMTHNANNPDDEKKIPTDTIEKIIGDVISSALFEGMSNLDRYGALQKMVEFEEQNREAIPSDAFEDTMFLFDLSGTKTGYDFSDMDTKKKFLERPFF